ncbi:unnamed protein product [Oppiella nova]|uniref:Carboxylesterase type B domain-containing protein n=1 Tax=Oppiella nova TaxID=334625 RepID=A0A7R9M9F8_9ACAR|nr:unnamed protein product [Oppiella nova]CAG2173187.1 unnamed protein product [Oppiella nova]
MDFWLRWTEPEWAHRGLSIRCNGQGYKNLILTYTVQVKTYLTPYNINGVDVNTTSGVVRGQTLVAQNKSIDQFLNIPYAEPPVGSLRI